MTKENPAQENLATVAATNAAAAAATASSAAARASENAAAAAAAASAAAVTTGVVSNDISWMKKSLEGIEKTLSTISNSFVSTSRFDELEKIVVDHETRVRGIEKNIWTWMGSISIITAVVTMAISFLTKFIK